MARKLKAAVAQLGPIHLTDTRGAVVKRLMAMMREAHAAGARFVVFPELALTTFFPRYWMTDQTEIDRYFEREMPGPETQALFDLARELEVGFYLGYAELTQEKGELRHYNTSILVETDGRIIGRYRKIHLPGHSEHLPDAPFQHLEKRYFEVGNEGFKVWRAFDVVFGVCICNDRRWPETFRVTPTPAIRPRKRVYCTAASKLSAKSSSSNRHVTGAGGHHRMMSYQPNRHPLTPRSANRERMSCQKPM